MTTAVESLECLPRRSQTAASLALLALLVATCLTTDLLARSRGLEHWLMAKSSEFADKTGTLFSNTGNFIDFEERVLLDEIPRADYSRGGVYFFGTSNTKWAFNTWDLPAEQRALIGNYGMGAASHTTVLRLMRFLIAQRGFLAAGDRDLVIVGASFHLGFKDTPSGFFASLLQRRGLYRTASDGNIIPAPMNPIERWLQIEKARSGGFIWNLGRLAKNWAKALRGVTAPPAHNPEQYRQSWREFMGPNWQQNMDTEIESLRATIELVRSHHAQIKLVLLPQGSWMDALPFKARYEAQVRALCQTTSTPLIDLSRSMSDQDFVDSNHLTVKGQQKFRGLIMGEIEQQARKIRASGRQP
jgi:hypothetical protein